MSFEFTQENLTKIEALKPRYPSLSALVLPLLWMAQEQEGYISLDAIEAIAVISHNPAMEVYRVATFYTMFHLKPVGTYHIQLCKTLSCALCGKGEILAHLKATLGIDVGETTTDGKFTLSEVECLGSCGTAPMMQINETNHEALSVEKVDQILKELS
jgi:NADH-quinone oxidoreductase subunit E